MRNIMTFLNFRERNKFAVLLWKIYFTLVFPIIIVLSFSDYWKWLTITKTGFVL